jgi:hypothetical protein
MRVKPIYRDKALQMASREYLHGMLLCWKIRIGFLKAIMEKCIKKCTSSINTNHLIHHFELEGEHIFSIPATKNQRAKKNALSALRLHRHFSETVNIINWPKLIREELERHITLKSAYFSTKYKEWPRKNN